MVDGRRQTIDVPLKLTVALAQMALKRTLDGNRDTILGLIWAARTRVGAGVGTVIVFPESALASPPGTSRAEILAAVEIIRAVARDAEMAVLLGLLEPYLDPATGVERQVNALWVIDARGEVTLRYRKLWDLCTNHVPGVFDIERADLFCAGISTRAMWFWLRGVPCVVTVGRREALWNEIAEMAALCGTQVHLHLEHTLDGRTDDALLRKQLWVNLASYHTLTATVLAGPGERVGGSVIWEDKRRVRGSGPYPYCAVPVREAGQGEALIYATQPVRARNPQFAQVAERYNPQMRAWYEAGARAIAQE